MPDVLSWDDLRFFVAVARCGSLRGAAREIAVNHSTILRRITRFERSLGVKLFERLPSGYADRWYFDSERSHEEGNQP